MDLAIADDCDVHLAWVGPILGGLPGHRGSRTARRYAAAIDAAVARGRCPDRVDAPVSARRATELRAASAPPGSPTSSCAATTCSSSTGSSTSSYLLGHALIHGRTDQFDTNLGFLARYPNYRIARIWGDGLGAVRKVIDGDDLDERELQSLATYARRRADRSSGCTPPVPRCPSAGAARPPG